MSLSPVPSTDTQESVSPSVILASILVPGLTVILLLLILIAVLLVILIRVCKKKNRIIVPTPLPTSPTFRLNDT